MNTKRNRPDISVIVMTYNPNLNKTLTTINSILMQKDISFEIIVTDDGSEKTYFNEIEQHFQKNNFYSYTLINNGTNKGTVKNILGAMVHVNAPYVKIISPGDYLYNETTLANHVSFMKEHGLAASFGHAVYYSDDMEFQVHNQLSHPLFIQLYNPKKYDYKKVISVMVGSNDLILGAAIVYKTDEFNQCLSLLKGHVKLCEDFSMQILALQKKKIGFIDEYVVWYEFGAGVSTNPKLGLVGQTHADLFSFYELALKQWPNEKSLKNAKKDMNALYNKSTRYYNIIKYSNFFKYPFYLKKGKLIKKYEASPLDKSFYYQIKLKEN